MKNILLIEDDPFLTEIYTTKLREAGFNVEVAENGEKGEKLLLEKKFDLLILDIVLPQINGWEVLEKIRDQKQKNKKLKDLKIIALSNLSQEEEIKKALSFGVLRYFVKAHYTPAEVIDEIKKIIKE